MISKLLIPLFIATQLPTFAQEEEEEKKNKSILNRIPIGATSTNVTIPALDKDQKRASLLTAKVVVVKKKAEDANEAKLTAKGIVLYLFNKKEEIHATAKIDSAYFRLKEEDNDEEEERLIADGNIHLQSADKDKDKSFEMKSQGGIFQLSTRQGLFLGPGSSLFTDSPKKKTAMKLRPLLPFVATIQLLIATPPPKLTAEELSEFERLVAPRFIPESNVEEVQKEADLANRQLAKRLANYLATVGKSELLLQVKAPQVVDAEEEEKLKENQTSIRFDGGAYFDGEQLEMVYLGNISLRQIDFTLTCDKDLKVILEEPAEDEEKKPEEKKKPEEEQEGAFSDLGDLKQITASGNLKIEGVDKKGTKIELKGDRALYDHVKESIIIRGDQLFFKQGELMNLKSTNKNAYISAKLVNKVLFFELSKGKGDWVGNYFKPDKKDK